MENKIDYYPTNQEEFESYAKRLSSRYGIATDQARCWVANYWSSSTCSNCVVSDYCIQMHKDEFRGVKLQPIRTAQEFCSVITTETKAGHKIACVECGSVFEDDDLAFANETGICPYCKKPITAVWLKKED